MSACVSPRGTVRFTPRRISRFSTVTCRSLITSVSDMRCNSICGSLSGLREKARVSVDANGYERAPWRLLPLHQVGQRERIQHVVDGLGHLVPDPARGAA